jgi:hypothetical protein
MTGAEVTLNQVLRDWQVHQWASIRQEVLSRPVGFPIVQRSSEDTR